MPVVRQIVAEAAAQTATGSPRSSLGIVESAPFQMRTKLEPAESVNAGHRRGRSLRQREQQP